MDIYVTILGHENRNQSLSKIQFQSCQIWGLVQTLLNGSRATDIIVYFILKTLTKKLVWIPPSPIPFFLQLNKRETEAQLHRQNYKGKFHNIYIYKKINIFLNHQAILAIIIFFFKSDQRLISIGRTMPFFRVLFISTGRSMVINIRW